MCADAEISRYNDHNIKLNTIIMNFQFDRVKNVIKNKIRPLLSDLLYFVRPIIGRNANIKMYISELICDSVSFLPVRLRHVERRELRPGHRRLRV